MSASFHDWPAQRNRPTHPRGKTVRRLRLQEAIGWPTTSKLVISGDQFMHPTKGRLSDIRVKPEHRLPKPRRKPVAPLQAAIRKMTNWQRHQYQRLLAGLRREGKRLKDEAHLALAQGMCDLPHRDD